MRSASEKAFPVTLTLVHYRVHYILRQRNSVHTLFPFHYFFILPFTLGVSSGLFLSGFQAKTVYEFRLYCIRATCTTNLTVHNDLLIVFCEEYYKLCWTKDWYGSGGAC
jgi:hypothetical protein